MTLVSIDKHHLHPFTAIQEHEANGPKVMDRAEGIHVYDKDGKQYIDTMAGLWCVNIGYGREEMADTIAEQVKKLSFYHSFMSSANEPSIQLSDKLASLAPGDLNHAFFCNSGSEANDSHVKMVWYYNNLRGKPDKKKIISRQGAYHGVTVAAASLCGLPNMHKGFDGPLDRFIHVSRPGVFWDKPDGITELEFSAQLALELEDRIAEEGPDTIAAFIAEPVMGAGGVIPPPEGYFQAIVPVLKKYDILFIADEVICGFGRLGKMFGAEEYDFQPDMMTLAKGLTSGYIPMAACLISDEIYDVLKSGSAELGPFAHGFTYTGHPVAAAAALKNIEIIEGENLVHNAANVGAHFQSQLRNAVADHPLVGEVRGLGLIAGVELIKDKEKKIPFDLTEKVARKMHNHILNQGLTCRPILNMLAFAPPLIMTRDDADEVVGRFAAALADLQHELGR
jgi:adenosylmethionine-8-amino-7-oxononanoate aminotransferase